uniref:Kinesin heavy chain, 5'-partial-like protein n=1 Tax=Oryza sativa subsp. japonica TaxID=39947 RepID=Q67UE9_ORYSJ|nr:kinesin heavy chain, 5'-partial-like protein [Oryza sativa Japonica Group]BAD38220.1 kinesin heavy chain, 5'-partial-like protein [Oryza sativa Japonica Group]
MWDPCTGVPCRPAFVRRRSRHTHQQLLLTPRPAASTGRASRANPASLHRLHLLRQAGLQLCRPRLSRRAGLHCHRLRLSAPSRSPTLPPNDAASAKCSHLPRPQLAVQGRHASGDCCRGHQPPPPASHGRRVALPATAAHRPATAVAPLRLLRPPAPPAVALAADAASPRRRHASAPLLTSHGRRAIGVAASAVLPHHHGSDPAAETSDPAATRLVADAGRRIRWWRRRIRCSSPHRRRGLPEAPRRLGWSLAAAIPAAARFPATCSDGGEARERRGVAAVLGFTPGCPREDDREPS